MDGVIMPEKKKSCNVQPHKQKDAEWIEESGTRVSVLSLFVVGIIFLIIGYFLVGFILNPIGTILIIVGVIVLIWRLFVRPSSRRVTQVN
jgi:Flp pilus assembly protein TadB